MFFNCSSINLAPLKLNLAHLEKKEKKKEDSLMSNMYRDLSTIAIEPQTMAF